MVRVVSCRFMRLSCSDNDHPLFRRYYARSNRERGVKLLRCFPHCCPEHVQRCYCGCSIHVQVTFAAELPLAAQGNLVVCARFEPSRVVPLWPTNLSDAQGYEGEEDDNQENERKIQPGEIVSLPESVMHTKGQQATQTVWIRADREGESKQTTKNAVLYVLNNHRFPKWLYSYDSSVTRTQREMTHHLVVYVFQFTGTRSQQGELDAAVLARHESPGFTLISYRRSGNNSRDAGCDLPAVAVSSDNNFAAVDVDPSPVISSLSEDMEIDSYPYDQTTARHDMDTKRFDTPQSLHYQEQKWSSKHQQEYVKQSKEEWKQRFPSNQPSFGYNSSGAAALDARNDMRVITDAQLRTVVDAEADEFMWQKEAEARDPGFREKTQHLLILWRFLQHVSFNDLKFSPDTVETHIRSHWLHTAAALRAPPINFNAQLESIVISFLTNIFDCDSARVAHAPASPFTDTNPHAARDQTTIRTSVYLYLRVLSSRSTQHLFREACQLGSSGTNKEWLRRRFVSLTLGLYDILDNVMREVPASTATGNQNPSLPTLVDNVLCLIYGQTYFNLLREEVSSLLLDRHVPSSVSDALNQAFRAFAVQVQESCIASVARYRPETRHQRLWDEMGGGQSAWNHRWLQDPGSVQLIAVENGMKRDAWRDASLVAAAQLVREFGGIDITVSGGESICMSLRSTLSFDGAMTMAPMELVLDGRLRGFRVLPSGISSVFATAGEWSVGDYEAMISDDGQCLNIHLFAFIEDKMTTSASNSNNQSDRCEGVDTVVRRTTLSLVLEQEAGDMKPLGSVQTRDHFIIVHGTVFGSTFSRASPSMDARTLKPKLSAMSSTDRGMVWNELRWTPLFEIQAGYVAL